MIRKSKTGMKAPTEHQLWTRRQVLAAGGATVVASGFMGTLSRAWSQDSTITMPATKPMSPPVKPVSFTGIKVKTDGTKPTYLPDQKSKNAWEHSQAENLFWVDILSEHALFFTLLMPGPDLASQRSQAEQFKASFDSQIERISSAAFDRNNYVEHNRSTTELAKPFIEFKQKMRMEQEAGRLNSLVWPLFFAHTQNEAERFVKRLDQLSKNDIELDQNETIRFWSMIMEEHSEFIAHLLDPQEKTLIEKAMKSAKNFDQLQSGANVNKAQKAADEIIDFKMAAEKGIKTGTIKSIIHPALAEHVRREAQKFADELAWLDNGKQVADY